MSSANVDLVRSSFEAFGRGDFERAFAAYDPAVEWCTATDEPDQNTYIGVPALRRFLEAAGFAGKPSTKWASDTVHDFMHAKIVVADDISFLGSFNLSHAGELNAENVLEFKDAAIADRLAAFVDEIRALYPAVTLPEDKSPVTSASPLL